MKVQSLIMDSTWHRLSSWNAKWMTLTDRSYRKSCNQAFNVWWIVFHYFISSDVHPSDVSTIMNLLHRRTIKDLKSYHHSIPSKDLRVWRTSPNQEIDLWTRTQSVNSQMMFTVDHMVDHQLWPCKWSWYDRSHRTVALGILPSSRIRALL